MQEVNAQSINHQQKHFMGSSWKFLPVPNTLQVWVFSVNTETSLGFCTKHFIAWAQSTYTFYFFPLVLLDDFFLQPHHKESFPYLCLSSAQWNGRCEQNDHWTGDHQEELGSKYVVDTPKMRHFQSSTRLQEHTEDEVSQRCPPAQKCMSPRQVTFFRFNSGCLMLQMLTCKQNYSKDTNIESGCKIN